MDILSNLCQMSSKSLLQLYIALYAVLSVLDSPGSIYLKCIEFQCLTSFRFLQ